LAEGPEKGWVDDLGVRRAWRRRGLALALLQHSFREFYKRGTRKVGLGVDASSLTGATRLYEKAGMHVARQFNSYFKVLRDGEELMTQSLED
jgi:ribosomal protein S18 acetylase RimI-like enzyme